MSLSAATTSISAESGKSAGSAVKGAGSTDDGGKSELYKLNQIWYRMPPTLSLVAKRTVLIQQAQQTNYVAPFSQNITFIFNSGEFFISPKSSYLYLQLGYNNPSQYANAKALISQGNACQLFEEIVFTSASGTEIDRHQNKGLHEAINFRYQHTQEYIDTYGDAQGAPTGNYTKLHANVAPVYAKTLLGSDTYSADAVFPTVGGLSGMVHPRSGSAAKAHWGVSCHDLNVFSTNNTPTAPAMNLPTLVIPFNQLLGCFNPYMGTLLPPGLMAGGRLDLRLKDPTESLQFIGSCTESSSGATVDTNLSNLVSAKKSAFNITNIYLGFDAFQMQDNVIKRLNEVSAGEDGLSLIFDTYDHTTTNKTGTGAVECQVQQARSRVSKSYCVVRDSSNLTNNYINSYAAEAAVLRASAKVPAGAVGPTFLQPVDSINSTGVGCGITPMVLLKDKKTATTYDWKDFVADTTATVIAPFQEYPPLPADPYSNLTSPQQSSWGTATVTSFQSVLGSLFFPQQPHTTPKEYYWNALYIMGKSIPDKDQTASVTYEDFIGGMGAGVYNTGVAVNPTAGSSYGAWLAPYGLAIYGMLAEKSQALQLSGLPISNARLLRHKFVFGFPTASGSERVISCFTEFTRLAKVYLGGRVVVRE